MDAMSRELIIKRINEEITRLHGRCYINSENYDIEPNELYPMGEVIKHNAKKLVNHICFQPSMIDYSKEAIFFTFQKKVNGRKFELTICADSYGYAIIDERAGKTYDKFPKRVYGEELYIVLNHIKLFYGGRPINTVLFSGAFNPPTIAHDYMVKRALKESYDYVIIAACNRDFLYKKTIKKYDPEKDGENAIDWYFSEQMRINMLVEMTYDNPNVLIYGIEDGYTYQILCKSKDIFNAKNMSFAMGSDKIQEVNRWGYSKKLLNEFKFYIMNRTDNEDYIHEECKKVGLSPKQYFVAFNTDSKYEGVSATEVRERIQRGSKWGNMVTEGVRKVIHGQE